MKRDEDGVVHNNIVTYVKIAQLLLQNGSILISWTDEEGSQLDILFTLLKFPPIGPIQGGLKSDYLYVSIMRIGAFGFRVEDTTTTSEYYKEKLGMTSNVTTDKLTELINGVRKELSNDFSKE